MGIDQICNWFIWDHFIHCQVFSHVKQRRQHGLTDTALEHIDGYMGRLQIPRDQTVSLWPYERIYLKARPCEMSSPDNFTMRSFQPNSLPGILKLIHSILSLYFPPISPEEMRESDDMQNRATFAIRVVGGPFSEDLSNEQNGWRLSRCVSVKSKRCRSKEMRICTQFITYSPFEVIRISLSPGWYFSRND